MPHDSDTKTQRHTTYEAAAARLRAMADSINITAPAREHYLHLASIYDALLKNDAPASTEPSGSDGNK